MGGHDCSYIVFQTLFHLGIKKKVKQIQKEFIHLRPQNRLSKIAMKT